ncbi:MAG TPA: glycosyltransferase family 25 protein [Pyrinomonadaceae bacterium]
MSINDFFPHQICINLDKRFDRWSRMRSRLSEHGLDQVVRFPAIDGTSLDIPASWQSFPGAYGCLQSHLAVVEQAREKAQPSVLIFEDDVLLAPELNKTFGRYVDQVPSDWDMLFFGAIHGPPLIKVASNVVRVKHSLSTFAYALKYTIYDEFIEQTRRATSVLDESTRALQKDFNCYCFKPNVAWVEEDYSDVREERSNLWWLRESLVLHGPEMDEVLKSAMAVISYRERSRHSFRNLKFTLNYLTRMLPNITLLVFEQGERQTLKPDWLPIRPSFAYLGDGGIERRSLIMSRAVEQADSAKDFFLFVDSDVFLAKEEAKAALLKCREYDFTGSFREICDLQEAETLRLLSGDERWDYAGSRFSRRPAVTCDSSFAITRHGLQVLAGEADFDNWDEPTLSKRIEEKLSVFRAPNVARRLYSG